MHPLARSIALPLALLCHTLFCLPAYAAGDAASPSGATAKRYVWAKTLFLRAQPDSKSDALAKIPYGAALDLSDGGDAPVKYSETFAKYKDEKGMAHAVTLDGNWRKVHWQDKDGWVFDGYLSRYPAPDRDALSAEIAQAADYSMPEVAYASHVWGAGSRMEWRQRESSSAAAYQAMRKYLKATNDQVDLSQTDHWHWLDIKWDAKDKANQPGPELIYSGGKYGGDWTLELKKMPMTFNEALLWGMRFDGIDDGSLTLQSDAKTHALGFVPGKSLDLSSPDNTSISFSIDCDSSGCSIFSDMPDV